MHIKKYFWLFLLLLVLSFLFATSFKSSFTFTHAQQSVYQARALLQKKVNISPLDSFDTAYSAKTNKHYFPLGIFPSVLLVPFVHFFNYSTLNFFQGYLLFFINLIVFLITYKIAKNQLFSFTDSIYLATAFCFGSNYILPMFVSFSYYYSQAVSALLILWVLLEHLQKNRAIVIGLGYAFILQTRLIGALTFIFYAIFEWRTVFPFLITFNLQKLRKVFLRVLLISIPILLSIAFSFWFNYYRFGNIFDSGYPRADVGSILSAARDEFGYFNFRNIPNNVYWYFFAFLDPIVDENTNHIVSPYFKVNGSGLGFFYVAPLFFLILLNFKISKETIPYWITIGVVLGVLLLHYTPGYFTFGPRYLLDILPFMYILLLKSFRSKKLSKAHKIVIIGSSICNFILVNSINWYAI